MDQLKEKARQLLEYGNIRELYNKVAGEEEEESPSLLGSLLYQFGSSPEFKDMQEDSREMMDQVLISWRGLEKYPEFKKALNTTAEDELNKVLSRALEMAQAGHQVIEWPEGLKPEEAREFLAIGNNQAYINFRDNIAKGAYNMEPGQWPEIDISGGKVKEGKAILQPDDVSPVLKEETLLDMQETMKKKVLSIARKGDLAADVFDIITAKWLREARHHEAMVTISADEIMEARGLQKMLGGSGRRGGYKESWRREIKEQIDILNTYLITAEMEIWQEVKGQRKKAIWRGRGRALLKDTEKELEINGNIDYYLWRIRPGGVFSEFLYGPGRETALLSNKALQYDYYRQQWEKKLTRYLAYIWRIDEGRTMEGLLVKTLLYRAGGELDRRQASRTRDRLEKALDQLKEDSIISSWTYEDIKQGQAQGRQWPKKWLEAKIILEAPAEISRHYLSIRENRNKKLNKGKQKKR